MRFMLLILGALAFLQLAYPLPVADTSSSSTSSEEEDTARDVLFKEGFSQLFVVITDSFKGMSTVFQNVITKAGHLETQNEELKKHLAGFTEFIDDVKEITEAENKLDKVPAIMALIEKMTKIGADYEKACRDHPEAFPEELFLEKNGLSELKKKTITKFFEFEDKVRASADAYYAGLTPEAAKKEQKFIDWYNQYKNADNMQKKSQLIFQFMNLYNNL